MPASKELRVRVDCSKKSMNKRLVLQLRGQLAAPEARLEIGGVGEDRFQLVDAPVDIGDEIAAVQSVVHCATPSVHGS
jgi:hypothetical protein